MKKITCKTILYITFLVIALNVDVYAENLKTSTFRHFESTSSSGYSQCQEYVEFNQVLNLNDVKVKLTQDDDTYTFKITANNDYDVKNNIGSNCLSNGQIYMEPFLYKTANFGGTMKITECDCYPFASCNSGTMTDLYKLIINNTEIGYHYYEYKIYADGSTYTFENTSTNNGDKFFIPNETRFHLAANTYNYRNRTVYPSGLLHNGDGVKRINNKTKVTESTRYLNGNIYVDSLSTLFDTTINIKKDYIDDYRYLCFGMTFAANTLETHSTIATNVTGYSLCTNTIDLKDYINCEHNWVPLACDDTAHTLKCSNCEWEKNESHNYEYSYDGIDNNVCVCTKVKKVHYYYDINDDSISTVSEIHNVNEMINDTGFTKKTGYKFKWYEKYELKFNVDNLNTLTIKNVPINKELIATVSSLDSVTANRSIYYKAIYEPIKYIFIYSNKSNVEEYICNELIYDKEISPQIFYYDSSAYLKKHIDYDYLIFMGWTLTEGADDIDFSAEQEIINYTIEDGKTYTLYPVYNTMKYKVLYNTLNGHYDNSMQQSSREYDFYTTTGLLIPYDLGSDKEFSHYIDVNGNRFEELIEIRDFVKSDIENNKTVILFANTKKVLGSDEGSDKTDEKSDLEETEGTGNTEGTGDAGGAGGTDSTGEEKNVSGDDDEKTKGENYDSDNGKENDNNGDINDSKENKDVADGNDKNADSDKEKNNNEGGSTSSNNGGNDSGGSNSSNSGGTSINRNESSSGGSGDGGKSITSNGSIINGVLTDNHSGTTIDLNSGTNVVQDAKKYLISTKTPDNTNNIKDTKKTNEKKNKEKILIKDDFKNAEINTDANIYGPRLLFDPYNYEGNIIRGLHGPWYFEQKYIDEILRESNKLQQELINDTKKRGKWYSSLNVKLLAFIVGSFLIIIFIILYEISTIKHYKKKRKIEIDSY